MMARFIYCLVKTPADRTCLILKTEAIQVLFA